MGRCTSRSAGSCRSPRPPTTPTPPGGPIRRRHRPRVRRDGIGVARCTVARLMRQRGLQGIVRGKSVRTTISGKAAPCPLDRVNRDFKAPAPNRLWISDFTCVASWAGVVYAAFVIDTCARRIVGLAGVADCRGELRARRLGAGDPCPPASARRRTDPSQRPRLARRIQTVVATPRSWRLR